MEVNDIVTVLTSLGTEYVGKMSSMSANGITLANPLLVTTSDKGIGFANGVAMTGTKNPEALLINLSQIVFVTETNEAVVKVWRQSTSGLIT